MTLLPAMAVADLNDAERARVRRFVAPAPSRTVRLIHGKAYLKRARVEAFAAALVDALPEAVRTVWEKNDRG